jgi:hypothetical protein
MDYMKPIRSGVTALLLLVFSSSLGAVSGITLVSPLDGSVVRPGSRVHLRVDVDPSVQASEVVVWNNAGARMPSVYLRTLPYETDLTIPSDWTGALRLMILVKTTSGDVLEGPEVILQVIPDTVPSRISVLDANKFLRLPHNPGDPIPDNIDVRRVRVFGHYLDNQGKEIRRDLSGSLFGTTYTSSDHIIATVDAEGVVSPIAPGIAFITVDNKGIKAYSEVDVEPLTGSLPPTDQTAKVAVGAGGFRLDRASGRYVQSVTIKNTSALPLPFPLNLIVADLPPNVELRGEAKGGKTETITPLDTRYVYLRYQDAVRKDFFMPGDTLTVTLSFVNNTGVPITYTPKVYSGRP